MESLRWHFKTQGRGARDRNPIQNEFFASEAVGSLVSALMREGMQNSGDARSQELSRGEPVRIRILVSGRDGALDPGQVARWSEGLWEHLAAQGSGLLHPPSEDSPCQFLTFEDFGTTGLTGDTAGSTDDARVYDEPFYCFFRAENTSSKKTGDGSWGVGKTVFPRASAANAFFALSSRECDTRSVLMGSLTLRTRFVNGVKYTPDAWFGLPEEDQPDGGAIQPVEDKAVLDQFAKDFCLTRNGEPGTSIVVPWCDESITQKSLAQAVIETNLIPVVSGAVEVVVASRSGEPDIVLRADTVEETLQRLALEPSVLEQLKAGVKLARWIREEGQETLVSVVHEPTQYSVKWDQYRLAEGDQESLRSRYEQGKPIAVRVPVPVQRKDSPSPPRSSHLDVFLQQLPEALTVRPVFVRGNVVVPDHKIRRVVGAVAIIRSSNDQLERLLRAAEDPGHKEWSTETRNFAELKESIKYPASYLTLARDAAYRVARMLQDGEAEEDFDLLADVFSLPKDTDSSPRPSGGGKKRKQRKKQKIVVRPKAPPLVAVTKNNGGFTVSAAGPDNPTPRRIRVAVAYDVRSKNPFKQWEAADFELDQAPIVLNEVSGLTVSACGGNRLILEVESKDFRLSVGGFDTERGDLVVDVRAEGRLHD